MSISKTPSGKWKARLRYKGVNRAITFLNKTHAEIWLAEQKEMIEESIAKQQYVASMHGISLSELIDAYEASAAGRRIEIKNPSRVAHLKRWKSSIGDLRVSDVTREIVRREQSDYQNGNAQKMLRSGKIIDLGRRRSTASAGRYLASLSAVFTWGEKKYGITKNPCRVTEDKESRNNKSLYWA